VCVYAGEKASTNQPANDQLYDTREKERRKKIGCCWENKRNVYAHIVRWYMYKCGCTRKDRKKRERGNIAVMLC
jgi:hypothetical protein